MATLGKYELVREIGDGGMSTVYEAHDPRIGRTVALKVLTVPPYLSQTQREALIERLKREARAAGRLNHPNIVIVYDVGEADGHHFIAMEHLSGTTLGARLDSGPLSPAEAARVLEQVADALDAAHAQGVLHRDIKPSNVMLLADGRVKLTDFGVARLLDDATITHAGATIGSPAYMAPEQVRGESATAATDRWSLGVLLYEMLAGRPPFGGENIPAVLHQVAYDPAPPLLGASEAVQALMERALAKDPAARPGSARELAEAFREASGLSAAPVAPPPQPERERELVGSKGATVVAPRPASRVRVPVWAWALPLVALLAAIPFLLRRPSVSRSTPPARVARPVAPGGIAQPVRSTAPAPAARPTSVKVTERSPESTASPAAATGPSARRSIRSSDPPSRTLSRRTEGSRRSGRVRRARRARPAATAQPVAPARPAERAEKRVASAPRRSVRRAVVPTPAPERRTVRAVAPVRPRPRVVQAVAPQRQTFRAVRETTPVRPVSRVRERRRPEARRTVAAAPRARSSQLGSASALNDRAYRLQRRGQHRQAEPLLREAVRRRPDHAYAQYNLGWSLLSQGKAREALGPLRRTARQQPRRWEPQHRLGQAYERIGDHEKARAAYARARAIRSGR